MGIWSKGHLFGALLCLVTLTPLLIVNLSIYSIQMICTPGSQVAVHANIEHLDLPTESAISVLMQTKRAPVARMGACDLDHSHSCSGHAQEGTCWPSPAVPTPRG